MELINLEKVNKKFCKRLTYSLLYGFMDLFLFKPSVNLRKHEDWGIHNIDLKISKGEYIGILGKNGSGKTTLVRTLSGIYQQNSGVVKVDCKVLPMFVGNLALNKFYSGLDNYYIMGTLLGYSRKQLTEKIPILKDFSELGDDLYNPMGNYSSGMRIRLRFGCVKALMPDVLIIDEALSVTDIHFQKKCTSFLMEYTKHNTVVIISHDMSLIKDNCRRIIVMEKGEIVMDTEDIEAAINYYKTQ